MTKTVGFMMPVFFFLTTPGSDTCGQRRTITRRTTPKMISTGTTSSIGIRTVMQQGMDQRGKQKKFIRETATRMMMMRHGIYNWEWAEHGGYCSWAVNRIQDK